MAETRTQANIRQVTWEQVRPKVKKVNPALCNIIDELNPPKELGLFVAQIPFGQETVQRGVLHLPDNQGNLVKHDNPKLDKKLQQLAYNFGTNPVSLVLKNSFEVYLNMDNYTIPYIIVPEGALLSAWIVLNPEKNLQPAFLWHISAGVRSMFMLSKISLDRNHARLAQHLDVNLDKPEHYAEHGNVFRKIYESENFQEDWYTEVLYFSKEWFDNLQDPAWIKFSKYLYESYWKNTEFWRNEFIWHLIFSIIQKERNLKPNPYVADTVKHLLAMSLGVYPGFAPSNNNSAAPISRLQQLYVDIYQLEYAPIIMCPTYFKRYYFKSQKRNSDIYYSLAYPTTINFSPKSKRTANKITELKEIHYLLNKYLDAIKTADLNLNNTPLAEIPDLVEFNFYHTSEISTNINSSELLPQRDQNFLLNRKGKFPDKSPFLRGCISISESSKAKNT
ncbi:MAG: hypothetical protein PVI75_03270 [Gammaproteobacteria bacterium]|jgi:hypothetical protein